MEDFVSEESEAFGGIVVEFIAAEEDVCTECEGVSAHGIGGHAGDDR